MPKAQTKEETTKLSKEQFFAHLDGLTVLELADYIKEFEQRYGISAAAAMPIAVAGAGAAAGAEPKAEEAKTEFTVVLKSAGDKKIKENISKEEAEAIKAKFEEVGAAVELQ
jgi:large subunit ribosomal protein L7/L12